MAVVLANSSLRSSGWQLLRQPVYLIVLVLVLVFGFAAAYGQWWVVLLELAFVVLCLWLAELAYRVFDPVCAIGREAVLATEPLGSRGRT